MNDVHFSSASCEWETPQDLFDKLHKIHNFDLDVCAAPGVQKCPTFFSKVTDGLSQNWKLFSKSCCWMNPPYGREIRKWMRKAYHESQKGCKVVCLVPARTDTQWWHEYAMKGEIQFLRGRLKFSKNKNAAPFPSAIVIFGGK